MCEVPGKDMTRLAAPGGVDPSAATALDHTFLMMLGSLVIAAALMLCVARRTYPPDVAMAIAAGAATASTARRTEQLRHPGLVCDFCSPDRNEPEYPGW